MWTHCGCSSRAALRLWGDLHVQGLPGQCHPSMSLCCSAPELGLPLFTGSLQCSWCTCTCGNIYCYPPCQCICHHMHWLLAACKCWTVCCCSGRACLYLYVACCVYIPLCSALGHSLTSNLWVVTMLQLVRWLRCTVSTDGSQARQLTWRLVPVWA